MKEEFLRDLEILLGKQEEPNNLQKKQKGKYDQLTSKNYPKFSWSLKGNDAYIVEGAQPTFKVVPGLTGESNTVSFQSLQDEDKYLRHYSYWLTLEPKSNPRNPHIFNEDATFKPIPDLWFFGHISFESVNYPKHYIRHTGYRLRISNYNNLQPSAELEKNDASFNWTIGGLPAPFAIQSKNLPSFKWGLKGGKIPKCILVQSSDEKFMLIVPGLTGASGSVSFMSASKPGYYLRHYSYKLYLEPLEDGRNPQIFKEDATFMPILEADGYCRFKSVNYPDRFISYLLNKKGAYLLGITKNTGPESMFKRV